MTIQDLKLTNFRSYADQTIRLGGGLTLVVGPNASGKTNLLESLYVLALTKSFRARDRDLVRHGQDFFRIVAGSSPELAFGFSIVDGVTQKKITHDGAPKPLHQHLGQLRVVLFEPGDLNMLGGVPEQRRRYLDSTLCQTDPTYVVTLTDYRRVLKQRNRLLDAAVGLDQDQLFAWNIQLASLAGLLVRRRVELIDRINLQLGGLYGSIAGTMVDFILEYEPSVPTADYADGFLAALERNLPRDLGAGFTTIGPHRDDFKARFKNNNLRAIASRGEVRTAVLALKLAELEYIEQLATSKPLLLFDDVFSELDQSRRGFLLERLAGYQAVITATEADALAIKLPSDLVRLNTLELTNA